MELKGIDSLSSLEIVCNKVQKEFKDLEQSRTYLKNVVSDFKDQKDKLEKDISDLTEKSKNLSKEVQEEKATLISQLETESKTLEKMRADLGIDRARFDDEVKKLENEKSEFALQKRKQEVEISEARELKEKLEKHKELIGSLKI